MNSPASRIASAAVASAFKNRLLCWVIVCFIGILSSQVVLELAEGAETGRVGEVGRVPSNIEIGVGLLPRRVGLGPAPQLGLVVPGPDLVEVGGGVVVLARCSARG